MAKLYESITDDLMFDFTISVNFCYLKKHRADVARHSSTHTIAPYLLLSSNRLYLFLLTRRLD